MKSSAAPALGLYFHVPFCRHVCPYCDFYKVALPKAARGARARYARAVIRELDLLLATHPIPSIRPLASIYFGGGTPSTLEPSHLSTILDAVRGRLPLLPDCEITLEANPETLTPSRLRAWRAAGINRLSIGVQSFDDRLLVKIGRGHTAALVRRALRRARDAAFDNLSLDLMFGLPDQTLDTWMASLEETIRWNPEHISFYGLTIHPGTPFHALLAADRLPLPDDDLQAEMYLRARQCILDVGYEHYEISNFALCGRRARHNENYWLGGDWLGLGPGAHSSYTPTGAAPVPAAPLRWENPPSLDDWFAALRRHQLPRTPPSPLSRDERRTEAILLGLRRLEGLDADALVRSSLRFDIRRDRAAPLAVLLDAGLIHWRTPSHLALTERGLLVADSVMTELA